MALSQTLNWTDDFNKTSELNLDIDNWDYVVVQLVTPTGAVNFLTTNDNGEIAGAFGGNAPSSLNYIAVQGTNLATGSGVTSLNVSGLVKFNGIGKFLQIKGSAVTVDKLLVRYFKIFNM